MRPRTTPWTREGNGVERVNTHHGGVRPKIDFGGGGRKLVYSHLAEKFFLLS